MYMQHDVTFHRFGLTLSAERIPVHEHVIMWSLAPQCVRVSSVESSAQALQKSYVLGGVSE